MSNRIEWWAALVLAVGTATPALAQQACDAVEIEPLAEHGIVLVTGINNWGQVIGFSQVDGSNGPALGFTWREGRAHALATLVPGESKLPFAINDLGHVVGYAADALGFEPAVWTPAGVKRLPGEPGDRPEAINAAGVIAGSRGADCIVWRSAFTAPTVLGNLGGDFCSVLGINERGELVGASLTASGAVHGFYARGGELIDVSDPRLASPVDPSASSSLLAINEHGTAAGWAGPAGSPLTFRLPSGASVFTSYPGVFATAINDWSTIFAIRASDEHLLVLQGAGSVKDRGALKRGVNGQQLYANDLNQIAWQSADQKGYFCKLGR
jgi:uncharacterized membrane protein